MRIRLQFYLRSDKEPNSPNHDGALAGNLVGNPTSLHSTQERAELEETSHNTTVSQHLAWNLTLCSSQLEK